MASSSLDRWVTRIERAARLLGERPDNPPALTELAAAAALSPFHFHRIWRALTGETVGQTVARLRVDVAKQMLADEAVSVTEVAMSTGFSTPQSFARAFRRQAGVTPTQYRGLPKEVSTIDADGAVVKIVRRDAVTVVALRREGQPYSSLNAAFGQVWEWAETAGVLRDLEGIYGVPLDDPESVPTEALRYDAALAVGSAAPPRPFAVQVLPAGRYARMRHTGSYDRLEASTQRLVQDWLLTSGEEPGEFPIFYQYLRDPDETPEDELETDILLMLTELENDR